MAIRIAGALLPDNKRLEIALTYIYGLGLSTSRKIIKELKLDADIRVKDISEDDANKLRKAIEKKYVIEGDLRREIIGNIKRLKEINSYRGSRHAKKLPVRGQRTKTNSRTSRGGSRKTVGSGRKAPAQKT